MYQGGTLMSRVRTAMLGILLLLVGAFAPVSAQDQSCPGVVIDDSRSTTKLNRAAICEAALPWTESFQVYVFLTDAVPANEDQWFSFSDAFEIEQGIFNPSDGTFLKTAVAFEASTMSRNIYAANITVGEALADTSLWDDLIRNRLKGQFRNSLNTGDFNSAFTLIIARSYETAFPAVQQLPPAAATQRPQATVAAATSVPAQAPAVVATFVPQQGILTQENLETSRSIFVTFVVIVLGLAGVALVVFFGIMPLVARRRQQTRYISHISHLQKLVSPLFLAGEGLLSGTSASQTPMYNIWVAAGGQQYQQADTLVLKLLTVAHRAFNFAHEKLSELEKNAPASLKDQISQWEILYLSLVGTRNDILSLNPQQQEDLLNPFSVVEREDISDELYQQIANAFPDSSETLEVTLISVDPSQYHVDGILGSIASVKDELARLKQASALGPETLKNAETAMQDILSQSFPADLTSETVLAHAQTLMQQAHTARDNGRWVEVLDLSNQILQATKEEALLVQQYGAAITASAKMMAELETLKEAGYRLESLQSEIDAVATDISTFKHALQAGEYGKAAEYLIEIVQDSKHALSLAQALQDQHQENDDRLEELKIKADSLVSAVKEYVEETVQELNTYPKSNWGQANDSYVKITQALELLRSDSDAPENFIYRITALNSLETQNFADAEQQLDEAFALVQTVEQHISVINDQLVLVNNLMESLKTSITATNAEILRAVAIRDADNNMVSPEVDNQLTAANGLIQKAKTLFSAKEYLEADAAIQSARAMAVSASESATAQIAAIRTLLNEMPEKASRAQTRYSKAQTAFDAMLPSLRQSEMGHSLSRAMQYLTDAQVTAADGAAQEDTGWLKSLQEQAELYGHAYSAADEVLADIQHAEDSYREQITATERAIAEAHRSIQEAERLSRHNDAQGAGNNAIRRAETSLPSAPSFGMGLEELRRARLAAEEAATHAQRARDEANDRIRKAESERERLRQVQLQLEADRRREQQRREDEERRERMRRSTNTTRPSGGSSFGSSTRSSSLGSRSNNTSMGARKR